MSTLASIKPNNKKVFVGLEIGVLDSFILEASALFGFWFAFERVLSALISGYPA